jgi:hypothetical protein
MLMLTLSGSSLGAQATGPAPPFPKAPLAYPTAMDPDDIAGVVTSNQGPEAGVWVIAETVDAPARFVRIVLTNDEGRYVLPDMPKGSYQVFVRGYHLNDSKRTKAWPGQQVYFGVTASSASGQSTQPRPEGVERNLVITMRDQDGPGEQTPAAMAGSPNRGGLTSVRVPYPEEFVAPVGQEQVEDDKAGWKGRSYSAAAPGKLLKVQVRPDPLAR